EVTRSLAEQMGGIATILAVAADSRRADAATARWKERAGDGMEVRVLTGNPADAILQEQSESFYDLLVASVPAKLARGETGLQRVLTASHTPMLFVKKPREAFQRILICTAVGEPGKNNVRYGGWLAFRLRAAARLLHVARPGAEKLP